MVVTGQVMQKRQTKMTDFYKKTTSVMSARDEKGKKVDEKEKAGDATGGKRK